MKLHQNHKKNLIISYKNLTEEVKKLFKEAYPEGYKDYLQKTIKPNGEPIFVVPLETEDTNYMIKFDVKIDTTLVDDDLDKDPYEEENGQDDNEYAPLSEAIDKEEGTKTIRTLQHGAYEDTFDEKDESKKSFELATADMEEVFGETSDGSEDDLDRYLDGEDDEGDEDEDDDMEPDDDELLDIENMLIEADSGEGLLREENPPEEEPHGRRKNKEAKPAASKKTTAKVVKTPKTVKITPKAAKKSEVPAKTAAKPAIKPAIKPAKVSKTVKAPKETPVKAKATPVKAAKAAAVKPAKAPAVKSTKAPVSKPAKAAPVKATPVKTTKTKTVTVKTATVKTSSKKKKGN